MKKAPPQATMLMIRKLVSRVSGKTRLGKQRIKLLKIGKLGRCKSEAGRRQKKDVKNEGRTDYVHENTVADDKMYSDRHGLIGRKCSDYSAIEASRNLPKRGDGFCGGTLPCGSFPICHAARLPTLSGRVPSAATTNPNLDLPNGDRVTLPFPFPYLRLRWPICQADGWSPAVL
jgi:hypothetical protein